MEQLTSLVKRRARGEDEEARRACSNRLRYGGVSDTTDDIDLTLDVSLYV